MWWEKSLSPPLEYGVGFLYPPKVNGDQSLRPYTFRQLWVVVPKRKRNEGNSSSRVVDTMESTYL